ncbi:MAG: hypothetical protein RLZZ511_1815 [Cyanobacteriota bacterium]
MNRQLRRIEQVLNHLEPTQAAATATLEPPQANLRSSRTDRPSDPSTVLPRSVSFQLTVQKPQAEPSMVGASIDLPPGRPLPQAMTIQTITTQSAPGTTTSNPVPTFKATPQGDEPSPEKFKLPQFTNSAATTNTATPSNLGFSRHQNGSNPDLALNLLQESLTLVQNWRSELHSIGQQIQTIYREGPVVDGWLECSTQQVEATTAVLRHAEVSHLMGYVETLCNDPSQAQPEYRLCGLSQDGRVWSSPCPQKQLASISLAISRHQKLQPLLQRKLVLERQLHQAAELTAVFHGKVQAL